MKFEIIEDKEQLYDKCENMEQLYDNYYYNLLVNYQELKKQNRKYKEVIDKAIEYIKGAYEMSLYTKSVSLEEENIEELLDILKEVE